jgi:uncharacterized protein
MVQASKEEERRMPIRQELIDLLVCPETRQPLSKASDELLAQLNARIRAGALRNRGGDPVAKELAAGLVRKDGKILYPVQDDIPVMLIEESIELD